LIALAKMYDRFGISYETSDGKNNIVDPAKEQTALG